ncbi:hypothetical protein FXO38_36937 [Capsicum annuum]|nr:hypothetical protein FXO38_36937 [Capsicum annuum]
MILVKLLGSVSAAGAEVEALSGNLPAETGIVIGKSIVRGKVRVEAGRGMIMIETDLGREDGPDEYVCAVQNYLISRVFALPFPGRDAFEHFIFSGWQVLHDDPLLVCCTVCHRKKKMFPCAAPWSSKLYNCKESHEWL